MENRGAIIVSWNFEQDDGHECLLIGEKKDGKHGIDVLNAIFGSKAKDLLGTLLEKKEGGTLND